jgi:hypothetical protein
VTKERNEHDFKQLIRNVKTATSAVLKRLDIDCIDKNTENQLIQICLMDDNCVLDNNYNFILIKFIKRFIGVNRV